MDSTSSTRLFSALIEVGRDGWATVWVGELLGLFVNESSVVVRGQVFT